MCLGFKLDGVANRTVVFIIMLLLRISVLVLGVGNGSILGVRSLGVCDWLSVSHWRSAVFLSMTGMSSLLPCHKATKI